MVGAGPWVCRELCAPVPCVTPGPGSQQPQPLPCPSAPDSQLSLGMNSKSCFCPSATHSLAFVPGCHSSHLSLLPRDGVADCRACCPVLPLHLHRGGSGDRDDCGTESGPRCFLPLQTLYQGWGAALFWILKPHFHSKSGESCVLAETVVREAQFRRGGCGRERCCPLQWEGTR